MKLKTISYNESNRWYTDEYIPSTKRNILIFSPEYGVTIGYYNNDKFIHKYWNQPVVIRGWREIPEYYDVNKDS